MRKKLALLARLRRKKVTWGNQRTSLGSKTLVRIKNRLRTDSRLGVKCVHGKHTECNAQHSAQAGNQKATGSTGEGLGAQFEFSDRRRGGSLRLRSGKNAGGSSSGG